MQDPFNPEPGNHFRIRIHDLQLAAEIVLARHSLVMRGTFLVSEENAPTQRYEIARMVDKSADRHVFLAALDATLFSALKKMRELTGVSKDIRLPLGEEMFTNAVQTLREKLTASLQFSKRFSEEGVVQEFCAALDMFLQISDRSPKTLVREITFD